MLTHGGKYYDSLRGEAHIVAQAYANFGKRVTNLNKKLNDRIADLEQRPGRTPLKRSSSAASYGGSGSRGGGASSTDGGSPVPPSPDYDAPSPEAADEMELE